MSDVLKAPFPAFGGKSQVADMVWRRLGPVRNFVEPFAFTAAVLLRRPEPGAIETINDLNAYVSNFWRSIKHDPEAVADAADWPVVEDDLHARHRWLMYSDQAVNALKRVREDPGYYDAKIAGWWCWGACCWIGAGWCDDQSTRWSTTESMHVEMLSSRGVHMRNLSRQIPHMDPTRGIIAPTEATQAKRPRVPGSTGGYMPGVISNSDNHRPQLADAYARGRGVNSNDGASVCADRRTWLVDWMSRLADRMRPVRVCCGHWMRVCDSESTLTRLGTTGVFLDPPYRKSIDGVENRAASIYANDGIQDVNALCDEVQEWSLKWGNNPEMRIAVCGLEGEYPKLDEAGWDKVPWKSRGGYGNRTDRGKENAARERIWFSKFCLRANEERTLFHDVA